MTLAAPGSAPHFPFTPPAVLSVLQHSLRLGSTLLEILTDIEQLEAAAWNTRVGCHWSINAEGIVLLHRGGVEGGYWLSSCVWPITTCTGGTDGIENRATKSLPSPVTW